MVMISKGSESETIEITKTWSMIQHQLHGKKRGNKGKESPFHKTARIALAADVMAEERKYSHIARNMKMCLLWRVSSRSQP